LRNRLAETDRQRIVLVGAGRQLLRHKSFAWNFRHRLQRPRIVNSPRPKLPVDHLACGSGVALATLFHEKPLRRRTGILSVAGGRADQPEPGENTEQLPRSHH
jgi:hypothetical protein